MAQQTVSYQWKMGGNLLLTSMAAVMLRLLERIITLEQNLSWCSSLWRQLCTFCKATCLQQLPQVKDAGVQHHTYSNCTPAAVYVCGRIYFNDTTGAAGSRRNVFCVAGSGRNAMLPSIYLYI